jgi:PhnB protein
MKTSYIYPGAYTLNAYITVKGCDKAIEFYKRAFGAIERGRLIMPDGKIGHAEIEIEGSMLMMAEENIEWGNKSPDTLGGSPISFALYVKDADAFYKKAVDAGARAIKPPENMFYGDRAGLVQDPYGYKWSILTHFEDVNFEEMQIRSDKAFAVK